MNNDNYHLLLYERAKEVQPNMKMLYQDLKSMGYTEEEIAIELSFALIHDGYRLRDLECGIEIKEEDL